MASILGASFLQEELPMGMAAFRVNEEERLAKEEAAAQAAECPMPEPQAESEEPKATTVTAKKSTSKG